MQKNMTAKQYLEQAYRINLKIQSNQRQLEELRALSQSISSPTWNKDKVQQSGGVCKEVRIVERIAGMEQKLNAEIDHYINLKCKIKKTIDTIQNTDYRIILQKRYLCFEKWEQIELDMNYGYQWIHKLHGRALQQFEKYI